MIDPEEEELIHVDNMTKNGQLRQDDGGDSHLMTKGQETRGVEILEEEKMNAVGFGETKNMDRGKAGNFEKVKEDEGVMEDDEDMRLLYPKDRFQKEEGVNKGGGAKNCRARKRPEGSAFTIYMQELDNNETKDAPVAKGEAQMGEREVGNRVIAEMESDVTWLGQKQWNDKDGKRERKQSRSQKHPRRDRRDDSRPRGEPSSSSRPGRSLPFIPAPP